MSSASGTDTVTVHLQVGASYFLPDLAGWLVLQFRYMHGDVATFYGRCEGEETRGPTDTYVMLRAHLPNLVKLEDRSQVKLKVEHSH